MDKRMISGDNEPAEENNELKLDTSGEYLSVGGRKPRRPSKSAEERGLEEYYYRIFAENAWLLYDNAEKITAGWRTFFAPVHIHNNLAYTGTSGFNNATVGVYVEWWHEFSEIAIDADGNLVWYIAGSPLSGANACKAVTRDGKSVDMSKDTSFSAVWQSFMEVNRAYDEDKAKAAKAGGPDSIEDVLVMLRGEEYRAYLDNLRAELTGQTK